ncbi:hypothetical protein HYT58_03045, partial [Candidatus Woesearchaeota archaeon]|nr:hypothetical protein [Candidatus Woesearchaeota archaeon]
KRLNTAGRFDEQDELGLPIFNQDGKRGFYVREDGLSRLSLDSGLYLYAPWDSLAGSSAAGRVVVCGEAAQNLGGLDSKVLDELGLKNLDELRKAVRLYHEAKVI